MAVDERDVDALVERIVHGSEERLVAELTQRLVDNLVAGVFSARDAAALEALARANKWDVDGILLAWQDEIAEEVQDAVRATLERADEADLAALEAVYGSEIASGSAAAARASGRSERFAEMAHQAAKGLADVVRRQNIAMAEAAERAWYEIAGDAIAAADHGMKAHDRIIADAVSKLASAGIETIDYRSGVRNQIDVAVRRHIVSQVSQAGGRMTLARLEAFGHDLVITSAHYGARPSHADWQGRPCCTNGSKMVGGVQYPGLVQLTGYGSVGGLKGVNCRHSIGPYFPGITELPDLEFPRESGHFGMTSEQYYDAVQRQRELERRVRKTKREVAALERAGLGLESPSYAQKRLVLGRQQATLREHVADNGLVRQPKREKAYGIGQQPRALRSLRRSKARLVKGAHPVTQEQIDALVEGDLSGIRFSARPEYSARISSYGKTTIKRGKDGSRSIVVQIGKQRRPGRSELVDTLVHEELEARIALNRHSRELYYRLNAASDDERHAYIQKIIDRYGKMKGL